jgi:hypothetical protein
LTDKTAAASAETTKETESESPNENESFVESDTDETRLHYGLGSFVWPVRIIWLGLACLAVYYIAAFYVPSLKAWMSWTPPPH